MQKALKRFNHQKPKKMQHQPYPHLPPNYGAKIQYAKPNGTAPSLNKQPTKFIQEVTGTFLCYTIAIDGTMLTAFSALATEQVKPATTTMQNIKQFLDYAAWNSKASLTYKASDMVLNVQSNASSFNQKMLFSRIMEEYTTQRRS